MGRSFCRRWNQKASVISNKGGDKLPEEKEKRQTDQSERDDGEYREIIFSGKAPNTQRHREGGGIAVNKIHQVVQAGKLRRRNIHHRDREGAGQKKNRDHRDHQGGNAKIGSGGSMHGGIITQSNRRIIENRI